MKRKTNPTFERRSVYEESALGRRVDLITLMRQRQTNGIGDLVHPPQLNECIRGTYRFRDDPRIMKGGEGTSVNSDWDRVAFLVDDPN